MNKKESLDLILLNVGRSLHDADWNWKGVNSPFARIYWVESGSAKVVLPDGSHSINPGHLYLVPSFMNHSYENNSFFILYYIHIYDEQNIFDQLHFPFKVEANNLDEMLVKRLLTINPGRELKHSNPDLYDNLPTLLQYIAKNDQFPFYSTMETKGILLQLFSRFLEKASSKQVIKDERIMKIIRYIRENIKKNMNIKELSEICFLTDDHFIRLFKKEMKCTPIQYINQKKIEKAQLMLMINDWPLKDIAYSLSFENISYFNRLFKKHTGMSPNQYKTKLLLEG